MDTTPLVDWAPLARLLLLAATIALVPLAWLWLRQRGSDTRGRLAALTALTMFLTFDLVVFGSFTRLTDSGLGCPDWPGCYGHASPLGAREQIHGKQRDHRHECKPHQPGDQVSVFCVGELVGDHLPAFCSRKVFEQRVVDHDPARCAEPCDVGIGAGGPAGGVDDVDLSGVDA